MTTATYPKTHAPEAEFERTLADVHEDLLHGVQHRAAAVDALIEARAWPHSELATLTGFLRARLLRQVFDEEHLLYPRDTTAAPFTELSAAHVRLYELTRQLQEICERPGSLPRLHELVDELLTTLRRHLTEEGAALAALADADLDVPEPDRGLLLIQFDALPTSIATQLCIERLLRLQPGEKAVVNSRDRTRLHDVRTWLYEFDAARFALVTASERDGGTRLEVSCRDPR